jgi:hypothetical protein
LPSFPATSRSTRISVPPCTCATLWLALALLRFPLPSASQSLLRLMVGT